MTKTSRIFSIAALSLLVMGCRHEAYTYDYILQHPKVMQGEIAQCTRNAEYTTYCDMIKHTSDEFIALENMRADDQERFGKQVLAAEQTLATLKIALEQTKENYKKTPQQKDVQLKYDMAKSAYKAQMQKVHILLAVIAATSSEGN